MFGDMSKVYGWDNPQKLYPDVLNKNTVEKAQMAEWLFLAITYYTWPLLFAVDVVC